LTFYTPYAMIEICRIKTLKKEGSAKEKVIGNGMRKMDGTGQLLILNVY